MNDLKNATSVPPKTQAYQRQDIGTDSCHTFNLFNTTIITIYVEIREPAMSHKKMKVQVTFWSENEIFLLNFLINYAYLIKVHNIVNSQIFNLLGSYVPVLNHRHNCFRLHNEPVQECYLCVQLLTGHF